MGVEREKEVVGGLGEEKTSVCVMVGKWADDMEWVWVQGWGWNRAVASGSEDECK